MAKKILIVDDMTSVRMFLRMILRDEGFELDEASDGGQATEKCLGDNPPDIVLLDVVMPVMDGYECCRRIKAAREEIYIIMVTTHGEQAQKDEAFAAGCNDHLTKPIRQADLLEKLRDLA